MVDDNKNLLVGVSVNYAMPDPLGIQSLNIPNHAKLHRIIAINTEAPDKSIAINSNGDVLVIQNIGIATDTDILQLTSNVVQINGSVGIGTPPAVTLDLVYTDGAAGGIRLQHNKTDSAPKNARIKLGHYLNAEESVTLIYGQATSSTNVINIGGGSGVENAATEINFYTAANYNTVTGTKHVTLNSLGQVLIGNPGGSQHPLNIQSVGGSNVRLVGRDNGSVDECTLLFQHFDGSTSHGSIAGESTTLVLKGGSTTGITINSSGAIFMPEVYSDDVGTVRDLLIKSDGQLGYDASSINFKENLHDLIDSDTSWIHDIRVVKYDRIDGSAIGEVGGIAEEVNLINSNMISYKRGESIIKDENGVDVINYFDTDEPETIVKSRLIFPILKEVQKIRQDFDLHCNEI